jgi:hypothetical protein
MTPHLVPGDLGEASCNDSGGVLGRGLVAWGQAGCYSALPVSVPDSSAKVARKIVENGEVEVPSRQSRRIHLRMA